MSPQESSSSRYQQQQQQEQFNEGEQYELKEEERHLIKLISQGSIEDLKMFLAQVSIDLTQVWDPSGFNPLHLAGYKNSINLIQVLCEYLLLEESHRQEALSKEQTDWINTPAYGDESFTAMHFAAFNGNVEIMRYLIRMGANLSQIQQQSKSGVSLFHVAAQGDSPSSLAFLKKALQNEDPDIVNKRDSKMATPLHWACYSGAESAVQYLIAWGADVNAQDSSGITPLLNAIKSSEEIKSSRSVRLLLIKGARRDVKDSLGRRPIDIAKECKIQNIRAELISFLGEPNLMQKCMIQTPMQKVQRSLVSVVIFIILYSLSFLFLSYYILPHQAVSNYLKILIIASFVICSIFFLYAWLLNPGFVERSNQIDFLSIIPNFDPNNLCPECELIKTKRSRHCNICNRCVERYDHHCPWINNCVGYRNHSYFYLYILTLMIYMLLVFYVLVSILRSRFQQFISIQTLRTQDLFSNFLLALKGPDLQDYQYLIFNLMALMLLALCIIFLVPLIILVCVQTKNILTNETTSERFSRKRENNGSTTIQDVTQAENQQHISSQVNDTSVQEKTGQIVGKVQQTRDSVVVRQLFRNCMQMSCGYRFETQQDLLQQRMMQINSSNRNLI